MGAFSIFPERASTSAGEVDVLYAFLLVVGIGMTLVIFASVFFFAIKYRRKSDNDRPALIHGSLPLEITWSVVPFLVMLIMFAWGTKLYFQNYTTPRGRTHSIFTSPESNGCGKSNIRVASVRSMSCTCQPAARSNLFWLAKM